MSLAFSPGKTSLAGLEWLNLPLSKSLLPPHPVTIGGVCVACDAGAWVKRSKKTSKPVGTTTSTASFDRRAEPNLPSLLVETRPSRRAGLRYPFHCCYQRATPE